MQYSRLFISSFLLFTEELKLDYVDEKTGEIPLSRFVVLGCLFRFFAETTEIATRIKLDFYSIVTCINSHVHVYPVAITCPIGAQCSFRTLTE